MKKEKIQPLGENVLVKVTKAERMTKSGIVLPDTASAERPQEGKVVAIGESGKIKVRKDQKIIFAKYSGSEVKIDGEEYLIIKNEEILAVIR